MSCMIQCRFNLNLQTCLCYYYKLRNLIDTPASAVFKCRLPELRGISERKTRKDYRSI